MPVATRVTDKSAIPVLIPAAGASRRMGGHDKLLEEVDGEAILRRTARIASAQSARVLVSLPDGGRRAPGRRAALAGLAVTILPIKDAHEGMAASLRAGVAAAGTAEGLMIVLPDMPDITGDDIANLFKAFDVDMTRAVRAVTAAGVPGHPVILPRRLFAELSVLTGDQGARRVLAGENPGLCPLPGRHAVTDLDTPEDWANWRAARDQ